MTIEDIISELKKGAIITHTLPSGQYASEYALEMGDVKILIPTFTFSRLRKSKKIIYAGSEGDNINIYEIRKL